MPAHTPEAIRHFLHQQVKLWNEVRKQEMFTLFHQMVPGRLTIEYVGLPVLEGWQALEDMWQKLAGKVQIEEVELLVNGQEAASHNINTTVGSGQARRPSIELYRFDGDDLQIRYFYVPQQS